MRQTYIKLVVLLGIIEMLFNVSLNDNVVLPRDRFKQITPKIPKAFFSSERLPKESFF